MRHVLVPLDSSELAERALRHACAIVEPGGMITLVSVVEAPQPATRIQPYGSDPYLWADYGRVDAEGLRRSMIDRAEAYLRGQAGLLKAKGYKTKIIASCGDAAEHILKTAQEMEAEAIIMSTHGRSGISKFIYGSVTQKVLSAAPCPVFVVPMKAA